LVLLLLALLLPLFSLVVVLYLCLGTVVLSKVDYLISERNSLTQEASLQEADNLRKQILRVKGDAVGQW
jgi:cysteinyl-tRNA synthetase